jgi:hypothetical protein
MMSAIFFIKVIFSYTSKNIIKKAIHYSFVIILCGILILNIKESSPWGKQKGKKIIEFEKIQLPPNTLLELYNFPTSLVIPILAKEYNFRALGYKHLNSRYMKGSDFVERGKFRAIRDEIEQKHEGPIIIIIRDLSIFSPLKKELHDAFEAKIKDKYCRNLHNNIDSMLHICVPNDMKDEILPEGNNDE